MYYISTINNIIVIPNSVPKNSIAPLSHELYSYFPIISVSWSGQVERRVGPLLLRHTLIVSKITKYSCHREEWSDEAYSPAPKHAVGAISLILMPLGDCPDLRYGIFDFVVRSSLRAMTILLRLTIAGVIITGWEYCCKVLILPLRSRLLREPKTLNLKSWTLKLKTS